MVPLELLTTSDVSLSYWEPDSAGQVVMRTAPILPDGHYFLHFPDSGYVLDPVEYRSERLPIQLDPYVVETLADAVGRPQGLSQDVKGRVHQRIFRIPSPQQDKYIVNHRWQGILSLHLYLYQSSSSLWSHSDLLVSPQKFPYTDQVAEGGSISPSYAVTA